MRRFLRFLSLVPFVCLVAHAQTPISSSADLFAQPPNCIMGGPATGTASAAPTCRPLSTLDLSSANLVFDSTGQILNLPTVFHKGPELDLGATAFGTVDRIATAGTGAENYTAIMAMLNYACANRNGPDAVAEAHIPSGHYLVTGTIKPACTNMHIDGDGIDSTIIQETTGSANLITVANTVSYASDYTNFHIDNLTLAGTGSQTTGTLLEVSSTVSFIYDNLKLENHGGRGIELFGGTERAFGWNLESDHVRWPFILAGDVNELLFLNTRLMSSGSTDDGICYNVNCYNSAGVPSTFPAAGTSGSPVTLEPDFHAAIQIDGGEDIHFVGGSIKATNNIGGTCLDGNTGVDFNKFYVEGFVNNTLTHAHQLACREYSHNTATVAAGATTIPVDDIEWVSYYLNSPTDAAAYAASNQTHANLQNYQIVPPDYNAANTTTLSSICAGVSGCAIYQSTRDLIRIGAGSSDGNLYLQTYPTHTWPPGAVIYRTAQSQDTNIGFHGGHVQAVNPTTTGYAADCSDTVPRPAGTWLFNPSRQCADVIAGSPYDGLTNITPNQSLGSASMTWDNVIFGINPVAGATAYSSTATYAVNAIVQGMSPDGNFYKSLVGSNTGNAPTVGGSNAYWALFDNEALGSDWIKANQQLNILIQGQAGFIAGTRQTESLAGSVSTGTADVIAVPYGTGLSALFLSDIAANITIDNVDNSTWQSTYQDNPRSGTQTGGIQGKNGFFIGDVGPMGSPTIAFGVGGYPALYPGFFMQDQNGVFWNILCPAYPNTGTCGSTYTGNWGITGNETVSGTDAISGLLTASGGVKVTTLPSAAALGTDGSGNLKASATNYSTSSITPTAVTAASCSDQNFTVTGIAVNDNLGSIMPPAALGNVSVQGYINAANTLTLHFCNPSAASVTPPAGVYSFIDF